MRGHVKARPWEEPRRVPPSPLPSPSPPHVTPAIVRVACLMPTCSTSPLDRAARPVLPERAHHATTDKHPLSRVRDSVQPFGWTPCLAQPLGGWRGAGCLQRRLHQEGMVWVGGSGSHLHACNSVGPPATAHPIPHSSLKAGHSWGREGREGRNPGQVHSISGPLAELQITCHSGPQRVLADGSLTREVRCSRGRHSQHQTSLAGVPVTFGRVYFTYSGGILLGQTPCRAGARVSGRTSAVSSTR